MTRWRFDSDGPTTALKAIKLEQTIETLRLKKWILWKIVAAVWATVLICIFTLIETVRLAML